MRSLLHNSAEPHVPDDSGKTALHFAVDGCDDTSTVEMLLSAGANVNALDRDGVSPLFLASERGKTEFVRVLLSHGANPIQSNLYCKNTADRTQLSNNVGREKEKEMLRESRDENQ